MNFVAIEGNIGAGKTSLAKMIAETYKARVILEQFSDNPFLPGFYSDPERYTFPLELSFLAERYNQVKNELLNPELFKTFAVTDYYFSKSLIFSGKTLSGHEYKLFRQLFDIMVSMVPKPDLYVYLHTPVETLLGNIKKRGRPYEQSITSEYLRKIQNSYFDYMRQQEGIKFLIIDTGSKDFVSVREHFELITRMVFDEEYPLGVNCRIL